MNSPSNLLAGMAVCVILAGQTSAQSARGVLGAPPLVPVKNEPPLLTVEPPLSAALAPERVYIRYRKTPFEAGKSDSDSPKIDTLQQTSHILGIDSLLARLASMRAQRSCNSAPSLEELATRQGLLEAVQAATLDVDGVLAEISNEQGQLANLRTSLESRRDKTVARLNAAALITGSGAGAVVSATQFTSLGGRTNNIGDGVGVGAGAVSTILSIIATRKQKGPSSTVGQIPNMIAPLFDQAGVLNTYYPPTVLRYLQTIPANEESSRGTRLEQLKAMWVSSGRIGSTNPRQQKDIAALTSSSNPAVRVSIQDVSNRIAMLVDVAGRASLMKRDLSGIMRSYAAPPSICSYK